MLGNLHGVETPAGGGFCVSSENQPKLDANGKLCSREAVFILPKNLADARVNMHGLSIEHRKVSGTSLSSDLAQYIAERSVYGRIVVVAEKPVSSLSAVRKQWVRILRRIYVERARTLNPERIQRLTYELARLQKIEFSAKAADAMNGYDVVFATANDLAQLAPDCTTLYVTYDFPKEWLHLMASWMTLNSLVVIYGQK